MMPRARIDSQTMENEKRFKRIYIEISNICNLQCSFCPVVEREKDVMSLEKFQAILSQAAPLADQVCLHVMGEPLGHPEFPAFVSIAEDRKVLLQITTNGTLLDENRKQALLSPAIRQINFSMQAFSDNFPNSAPETHWRKVLEFAKMASSLRPELYINFRLWNLGNENQSINEAFITFLESELHLEISRKIDPALQKSKKLLGRLYLHFDSRFDWPIESKRENSEVGYCYALNNHVAILSSGTVVPCCLDKEATLKLGNCLEQTLEEILESTRAKKIRDGFAKGKAVESLCQRCDYSSRFQKKALRLQKSN